MALRINLTNKKSKPIKERIQTLDSSQEKQYKFWKKFFSPRFAVWAAENNLGTPDIKHKPTTQPEAQVWDTLEKRMLSIELFMKAENWTKAQAIKYLDDQTAEIIDTLQRRGFKHIEDDNIFFSYSG